MVFCTEAQRSALFSSMKFGLTDGVQDTGLQSAEAIVQIWNLRFGEGEGLGIAYLGQLVDDRAARVGQAEDFCRFVEGFTGSVIDGFADDFHVKVVLHHHNLGVTTRDGETQEREVGHLSVGVVGSEMHQYVRIHVVNLHHWDVQRLRESLCKRSPDEQGAQKSGTTRKSNGG